MSKIDHKIAIGFGPIVAEHKHDCLEIKLPKNLRDKNWADSMGGIQDAINRYASQGSDSKCNVVFDFSVCRWIDPLPLLSVLLEIVNARHLGMIINILLPEPDSGPNSSEIGPYQESPNRLLRFMSQEGFFDCLDKQYDNKILYSSMPDKGWDTYRKLDVKPSYEDARCIPMSLFIVPNEANLNFARDSVETLLGGVDSKLESKVKSQARGRLIYNLRLALQEVLHNVQEHAYETNDEPRLLAIYVRYRTGKSGLDSTGVDIFREHVKEENIHCPRLEGDWLSPRPGCLEVFILDRGIGMVHSFEKAGISLTEKYKFNQVLKETFIDGRSTKPNRQTRYGGLHQLYNLLAERGDFLRALEDGIWFGSVVPIPRDSAETYNLTAGRSMLRGLAMHLRLCWREETDFGEEWASFEQGEQSEIWKELCLNEDDCSASFDWFERQKIFDDRFGQLKEYGELGNWILWLVRPHLMKWDIINFIENLGKNFEANDLDKKTLVIADIPSYEAATYAAALDGFKARGVEAWPTKFFQIILSTNRWRFAFTSYKQHRDSSHGFSDLYRKLEGLKVKSLPIMPKTNSFRLAIVRWLKWHDSRLFWEEVDKQKKMFLPEQVIWGSNESRISGYLDFAQTTRNSLCSDIYRGALARILGILPANEVEMYPLDRLVMPVLQEIHAAEVYEPATDSPVARLALGSVLVSGSTLKTLSAKSYDLHFFIHFSSPLRGFNPSLLFWIPKTIIDDSPPRLSRIGKTATVAPEGWKSFELPRYDDKRNCVGTRKPETTYQDWQNLSPVIVKMGHWAYEGHHDLLTINIVSAVEAAFLEKNELSVFLIKNILSYIGLKKEHLQGGYRRLWDNQYKAGASMDFAPSDYGLLVFRSHPCSETIVRKLMSILTIEGQAIALSRIFPVLPVRTCWGGSTLLIPPLVRENIRTALQKVAEKRKVLLFDDAAITGRTLYDLRVAVSDLGAEEIHTVVIANRLRQPANGYGNERMNYYWRLDVPVMGREGNCPFCHMLHLVDVFSTSLASTNAKKKIRLWKEHWDATSPLNNWSGGLRPLPLGKTEKGVKYCYRLSKDNANSEENEYLSKIDLNRSTGLSIFVTELHAMTGRDDYCLKKIQEHKEPEIRIELASSQLLLFGDEFDLDTRIELIQTLIRELANLKEESPHASLATLVIIRWLGLLDKEARPVVAKIVNEEDLDLTSNYASKILLSYLVSQDQIKVDTDAYNLGRSLLSTEEWALAQQLNTLFLETLSSYGNAHSKAIPVLIDYLMTFFSIKQKFILDAIDSMDHLADIVERLGYVYVIKGFRAKYRENVNAMKSADESARKLLEKALITGFSAELKRDTKCALEQYISAMKAVADGYFHRLDARNYYKDRTFEEIALSRVMDINFQQVSKTKQIEDLERSIKISMTGEIDFDSKAGEVWIAWHNNISGIVYDLLLNAVYASRQIPDPWDPACKDVADLWIRVNYRKEAVELIMANSTNRNPKEIFKDLKKSRWTYLIEQLGGSVDHYPELGVGMMGLLLRIPYAGCLVDGKEDK